VGYSDALRCQVHGIPTGARFSTVDLLKEACFENNIFNIENKVLIFTKLYVMQKKRLEGVFKMVSINIHNDIDVILKVVFCSILSTVLVIVH
jgi:hypothetical protein